MSCRSCLAIKGLASRPHPHSWPRQAGLKRTPASHPRCLHSEVSPRKPRLRPWATSRMTSQLPRLRHLPHRDSVLSVSLLLLSPPLGPCLQEKAGAICSGLLVYESHLLLPAIWLSPPRSSAAREQGTTGALAFSLPPVRLQ